METIFTKEIIQDKLRSDRQWMERGLIVLYNFQTNEEKSTKETRIQNGLGFNSSDSRYLTWVSEWLLKSPNNHLNEKHMMKVGKMLPKYWGQINRLIKQKQGD